MDAKRRLITILVGLVLVLSLLNFIVMIILAPTSITPITGKATSTQGNVSICIDAPPLITAIADQAATVDTAFALQVTASDGDDSTPTYYDDTALFVINQSGYISFTPTSSQVGTSTILITVEDDTGCLAHNSTDDFILTISAAATPGGPGGGGGAGGAAAGAAAAGVAAAASLFVSITPEEQLLDVAADGEVQFRFAGETYTITVSSVTNEKVTFIIRSPAIFVTLFIGEEARVDLDGDDRDDLWIKLETIKGKNAYFQVKLLRQGFTISDSVIKATARQSQQWQRQLTVASDFPQELLILIDNALPQILALEPSSFTLPAGERRTVDLTFNPNQNALPNVYMGEILFLGVQGAETFEQVLTVVLEVESDKTLLDLSLDIAEKIRRPGETIEAIITLFNVQKEPVSAIITYALLDTQGNVLLQLEESLSLEKQASFSKTFPLPENIAPGTYVLAVKAAADGSLATATELITVPGEEEAAALAGLAASWLRRPSLLIGFPIFITLSIIAVFVAVLVLHRRIKHRTIVKEHVKERVVRRIVVKPKLIDTSALERKMQLLKESYQRGFIKEESYRQARTRLEELRERMRR